MAAAVMRGCRAAQCAWRGLRCSPLAGSSGYMAGDTGDHRISFCQSSTYSVLPDDYNCKVELAMSSDGKTIVCYHPSVDIPYEHTKPIPRRDPLHSHEESLELVLKAKLSDPDPKPAPTIEELSKMFYTTKHRWYPVGQYHKRRMKKDPPKDR
ncbi:large ribosomal subunit protein mL42 [Pseudophryne corroboree]|uniref:large ribosomal subunit protein mL42 n=1 Tax=Pseudophryne corroboree TaxID=495146 RepID=UPI003081902E